MYQIVEYFKYNPQATALDAASYFEKELEIGTQVEILKEEVNALVNIRKQLRPLYAEKNEALEKTKYAISNIEGDVYMEYPPRKGSETEREILRNKLKKTSTEYIDANNDLKVVSGKIEALEDAFDEWERRAKAARRLTELMQAYLMFIKEFKSDGRSLY